MDRTLLGLVLITQIISFGRSFHSFVFLLWILKQSKFPIHSEAKLGNSFAANMEVSGTQKVARVLIGGSDKLEGKISGDVSSEGET